MLPPFQRFFEAHRHDVRRFLVAAVGPAEADDCLQETFVAALRAYPRLAADSNLRAWVLTIASRKAIDAHRGRARRPVAVDPLPEPPPAGAHGDGGEPALWAAVRGLPPGQRAAVVHRYVSDLSYADIGRVLGCSEEAARQRVSDGLARLRKTTEVRG